MADSLISTHFPNIKKFVRKYSNLKGKPSIQQLIDKLMFKTLNNLLLYLHPSNRKNKNQQNKLKEKFNRRFLSGKLKAQLFAQV